MPAATELTKSRRVCLLIAPWSLVVGVRCGAMRLLGRDGVKTQRLVGSPGLKSPGSAPVRPEGQCRPAERAL